MQCKYLYVDLKLISQVQLYLINVVVYLLVTSSLTLARLF